MKEMYLPNKKKKYKQYYFDSCLIKIIIIFTLLFLINNYKYVSVLSKSNKEKKKIKICICTPGKKENRYILEFISYYKKLGVDKIFLYDNNDVNDEKFDDLIKDYVEQKYVQIFNWRGRKNTGYSLRNNCYINNYKIFDWIIFYDIDEYIHLANYTNIKDYLNEKKFDKCLKINLNWNIHTDNNLIYYDNRTLKERFPEKEKIIINKRKKLIFRYKFILRGHIFNPKMNYYYLISKKVKGCNGNGKKSKLIDDKYMTCPDFDSYYIDHYYFKSLEEFVEKINKGDNYYGNKISLKLIRIKRFFKYNIITVKKLEYIEKKTGINLSKLKDKIKK